MARKAVNVHRFAFVFMFVLSVLLLLCRAAPQNAPPQKAFDDAAASRLLMQLSQALEAHIQRQFLAAFELEKMKEGAIFRQQINAFFSHTESFRVHMNLAEVGAQGEQATVVVDAELEGQPSNGGPAWRRNQQLNFVVAGAAGNWKFIEVQPRSFFSLP
jgi:hypothetical protein